MDHWSHANTYTLWLIIIIKAALISINVFNVFSFIILVLQPLNLMYNSVLPLSGSVSVPATAGSCFQKKIYEYGAGRQTKYRLLRRRYPC